MINGGNRNRGGFYDAGQLDAIPGYLQRVAVTHGGSVRSYEYRRQWTEGHRLCSRFVRLREDKKAKDVVREMA
jgi:hypothetical protein